ncbi:MAG TPA: DUF2066 domain-containing protein [Acetobacteraceae bacterium]
MGQDSPLLPPLPPEEGRGEGKAAGTKGPSLQRIGADLTQECPAGPPSPRPSPGGRGRPGRIAVLIAWLAFLFLPPPAQALGLYEASVIVTGTDARSRPEGLGRALAQVLAKVSGSPALLDDPKVAALAPAAPGLVASLAYLDQMSDLPRRDEQGSRDRPYDLVVRFDPASLDAMLEGLGETPWRIRPPILVDLRIEPRSGPAMPLRADTAADERHRAALLAAADGAGLQMVLPLDRTAAAGPARPDLAPPPPELALRGTVSWVEGAGWTGRFTLPWHGRDHTWNVEGVSFDEAYRVAMRGAARVLSGHDETR